MAKPLVFLSHINEEAELAGLFKAEIESNFLGMVDVFVSSEDASISVGSKWLDRITDGLQAAEAMLLLCSPVSIGRPWINFEAGAGWARKIPVAPLCHSGLRPAGLPVPLNMLQAIEANSEAKLADLFKMIASKLNSNTPAVDARRFTQKVIEFEGRYAPEIKALPSLRAINSVWPEMVQAIKTSGSTAINASGVEDWKVGAIRPHFDQLKSEGLLDYSYTATGMHLGGSGKGITGALVVMPTPSLVDVAARRF